MHQIFQSLPLVPISFRPFFYGMAALALGLFVVGTVNRMRLWALGRDRPNAALAGASGRQLVRWCFSKFFARDCILASRSFQRSRARGTMLVGIIWGSLILLGGVLISAVISIMPVELIGYPITRALAILMDVGGALLFAGLLAAIARRYVVHPAKWVSFSGDGFMLILFAGVVLLGFAAEGARLAGTGLGLVQWYPVGALTGLALTAIAPASAIIGLYPVLYLLHAGSAFALIAYVPFSRLFHIFASQITAFAAREELERHARRAAVDLIHVSQ